MSKPKQKELMRIGIKWVNVEGAKYFLVSELRENCPDLKIDTANLIESPMGKLVPYSDIHEMTDFDKMIISAGNYNPKAK